MTQAAAKSCSQTNRGGAGRISKPGNATPWPSTLSQDAAHLKLGDLMRGRLSQVDLATSQTWAQKLIDAWLGEALGGNFRAIQEIVERIDGDPASKSATPAPPLDENTACKILEILCDPNDDLPSD